jgi:ribosomal protein L11 methylase PrmA
MMQSCAQKDTTESLSPNLKVMPIKEVNIKDFGLGSGVLAIVEAKLIEGTGALPIDNSCIAIRDDGIVEIDRGL